MKSDKLIKRSGSLESPYGNTIIAGHHVKNGHRVIRGKLAGIKHEHEIPEHWIRERKKK